MKTAFYYDPAIRRAARLFLAGMVLCGTVMTALNWPVFVAGRFGMWLLLCGFLIGPPVVVAAHVLPPYAWVDKGGVAWRRRFGRRDFWAWDAFRSGDVRRERSGYVLTEKGLTKRSHTVCDELRSLIEAEMPPPAGTVEIGPLLLRDDLPKVTLSETGWAVEGLETVTGRWSQAIAVCGHRGGQIVRLDLWLGAKRIGPVKEFDNFAILPSADHLAVRTTLRNKIGPHRYGEYTPHEIGESLLGEAYHRALLSAELRLPLVPLFGLFFLALALAAIPALSGVRVGEALPLYLCAASIAAVLLRIWWERRENSRLIAEIDRRFGFVRRADLDAGDLPSRSGHKSLS